MLYKSDADVPRISPDDLAFALHLAFEQQGKVERQIQERARDSKPCSGFRHVPDHAQDGQFIRADQHFGRSAHRPPPHLPLILEPHKHGGTL